MNRGSEHRAAITIYRHARQVTLFFLLDISAKQGLGPDSEHAAEFPYGGCMQPLYSLHSRPGVETMVAPFRDNRLQSANFSLTLTLFCRVCLHLSCTHMHPQHTSPYTMCRDLTAGDTYSTTTTTTTTTTLQLVRSQ